MDWPYFECPDPQKSTCGWDDETGEALVEIMDGWERIDYIRIRHMFIYFIGWGFEKVLEKKKE